MTGNYTSDQNVGFQIPTWKAVPRNKHTGRFPYKSPRDVATLLLSPSQHQEDQDEVSWGKESQVGSKYPAAKMTHPPPTSSGLSCQPLELSPPSCPQVSQTRHVQTKVTISSKPALLSANATLRKGTASSWAGNPEIIPGRPLPCQCWSHGCQTLALFSLIQSPHPLAPVLVGVLLRSTIASSVVPFSCLQSFPASGSFPVSQFFPSGGESIGASASVLPKNEYLGLISFRIDWFDFLAVQGTLKSLLQHHSSKASILWPSSFFIVQLSLPYMTTGKTIAWTR